MGKMGQLYIAQTLGTDFTLYAAMRKLGIPLSLEQEKCQQQLEKLYSRKEVRRTEKGG